MSEKASTRARIQFSKKIIRQAVQEMEEGSLRKKVCSRYGMACTTCCQNVVLISNVKINNKKAKQFVDNREESRHSPPGMINMRKLIN